MTNIWAAVVITCADQDSAEAFGKELELRKKKQQIDNTTLILCVVDPKPNIGSGGATLNAILSVTEHISALEGYTVISPDVLHNKRILIVHMGTTTPYSGCSPGFLPIPAVIQNIGGCGSKYSAVATQFDILFHMTINKIAANSPSGFWVCSCDRMITIPKDFELDWSNYTAPVYMFGVPVDIKFAANQHGVIKISSENVVEDIIYKGSIETIQHCGLPDGKLLAVSGIVFLTSSVVDTLLNMSVIPPLDSCTYIGLDAGARPTQQRPLSSPDVEQMSYSATDIVLSLFFDVLLCMVANIRKDDFVHGQRSGVYGTVHFPDLDTIDRDLRTQARNTLWDSLNSIGMKACVLSDSEFHYLSHDPSIIHKLLLNCPYQNGMETSLTTIKFRKRASTISLNDFEDKHFVVVNSILNNVNIGSDCVILHSSLKGHVSIGNNSLLANIQQEDLEYLPKHMSLPDNIVLESLYLKMEHGIGTRRILLMFGMNDKLQTSIEVEGSTVFNQSWNSFFGRTGIAPNEIWPPDVPASRRCLLNARLFPVYHPKEQTNIQLLLWLQGSYTTEKIENLWRSSWRLSLKEVLDLSNPRGEFAWRRELFFNIGMQRVQQALHEKRDDCFIPFFGTCILDGYFERILECLDKVALSSSDAAVISRTFACIADVLGYKAGGLGGLRSGPAANQEWKPGLDMVQESNIKGAVEFMSIQRKKWFSRPDLLIRAARHYEGAFQIQVRKAVATARKFVKLQRKEMVAMDTWVTAEAPGRLDLCGGWSDTPPICFDKGGLVVSFALQVDGKKPIGCRTKRIQECKIVLRIGKENPLQLEIEDFSELLNYQQPNSPGALLKAAFFCAEILPLRNNGRETLKEYLKRKYNSGFILQTWSNLPHGSGLGTSSILAGTVISALWTVAGLTHDLSSVLHAVLDLEQMLTTGGGWQDQVGGLCPGIKAGSSKNSLPLEIGVQKIECPEGFLDKLEQHLLVVFTGKTRLARNMLQDVLRNWNARFPEIVDTASQLIENAKVAISALQTGDMEKVGECLNNYWCHKKLMAHGCEPASVRAMMDRLQPFTHGQSLAGAGGGGFMYVITKEPNDIERINDEINKVEGVRGKATVHYASIDREGLTVSIDAFSNI